MIGGAFTVVVVTLFLVLFVNKSIVTFGKTNPSLSMIAINQDLNEQKKNNDFLPVVLKNEVFMFAITALPEDLGRVEAVMVDHFQGNETILPLVDFQSLA